MSFELVSKPFLCHVRERENARAEPSQWKFKFQLSRHEVAGKCRISACTRIRVRASLTSTVATKPNELEWRNATRPLFLTTLYRPILSIIVYHRVYRTLFLSLLQRSFIGTLYCALYCALFHRYTASRIIPTCRDLVNDSIVELTTRRNRVIIWISGFDGIVLLIGRHRRLTFTFRARV